MPHGHSRTPDATVYKLPLYRRSRSQHEQRTGSATTNLNS